MDNQYSAVDILCRPGPSTVLTSEDDRGIRRWEADLVVALLHKHGEGGGGDYSPPTSYTSGGGLLGSIYI